jgi:hypothetical protein
LPALSGALHTGPWRFPLGKRGPPRAPAFPP